MCSPAEERARYEFQYCSTGQAISVRVSETVHNHIRNRTNVRNDHAVYVFL